MQEDGVDIQDDHAEWDKTMGALRDLAAYRITVGVHGGGKPRPELEGLTTAQLAAVHEFGATINHPGGQPYRFIGPGQVVWLKRGSTGRGVRLTKPYTIKIPPRSFLRATVDENIDAIWAQVDKALGGIVDEKWTASTGAERIALFLHGLILKRINDGIAPPLKPKTLERKTVGGKVGTTPLVDTGGLKSSITWVLRIGIAEMATGGGT